MPATKTNWICIYTPPLDRKTMEEDGYDDDPYYDGIRFFIKDGDPRRVFGIDNSGRDPYEADKCGAWDDIEQLELDLTRPAVLEDHWKDKHGGSYEPLPTGVRVHTVKDNFMYIPFEGALFLAEKWGLKIEDNLSDSARKRMNDLARIAALAEEAK